MNRLINAYMKYRSIINSYTGLTTNWLTMYYKLDELYNEVRDIHFIDSKNSSFYNWVKNSLTREIIDEKSRVLTLAMKQRNN